MTTTNKQERLDRMFLQHEVEQFLYYEQSLLDERRWTEWLALLTDDVRYFMPMARNIKLGEDSREFTRELADANWMDEGKPSLERRVNQLATGAHWAEEPLSRTVHIVSNLRIVGTDGADVHTNCNFLVYRNRVETETDIFVGRRNDVVRKVDGGWRLARREILLAQNVLLAKNLSVLF